MNFTEKLEDLFEQNADAFKVSKLFKERIKLYNASLQNRFIENLGKDFLVKHTKAYDSIISDMYKAVLRQLFGIYLPMRSSIPIAVIALGSYGREQLSMHSDIDLMIVFEEVEAYNTKLIIEKLLYLAWDAGLKLGHRVHEVHDIFKAANEDITIRTAMMEARFIVGSNFTYHATEREFNRLRQHDPKAFVLAKVEESQARRRKYPISMQPNMKEGVGALRDSNLLFWIAKTIYSISQLRDLVPSIINEEDYREYRIALELIFRVRSALHISANKQQDQLSLDYIPQLSTMLGFKEQRVFVTKVLTAQAQIDRITQIYVKKFIRPLIYGEENYTELKNSRIQKNIYHKNSTLYASYHCKALSIDTLFELILSQKDEMMKFDPSFIYLVSITDIQRPFNAKTYKMIQNFFMRAHTYPYLELFFNAGVIEYIFSSFKKVMYLPQFDGYHDYSVDRHSIKCVEALENIQDKKIQTLFESLHVEEKLMLKIAVLLHDTGKGRIQDHSEVGAKLISAFAKRLQLSESNISTMTLLVKQHVTMSIVAQRENIYNEKTLYKFMSKVQTKENLKLLYILTYADINGVGKNIYNTHTAKLLEELYYASLDIASQSDRISDATKRLRIENRIKNVAEYKELSNILKKKTLIIESNLFYFKHKPKDIIAIATEARNVFDYSYSLQNEETLSIEIFRKVPLNLGYLLGKLQHLDVASMDIFTLFDDVKYFKIAFFNQAAEDEIESTKEIIENSFDMHRKIELSPIKLKEEDIKLDCEHSLAYAELIIHTANQRGLLAYLVEKLEESSINITTAKIHSTKNKARDHFLIEKQLNMCDNADNLIKHILEGYN